MSKAKVRSMQRGAQKRDRDSPINLHELYKKHPPQLAQKDKAHLDFVRFGKMEKMALIKEVILAADKKGIGTASEICSFLNIRRIKTAVGENWSPRLAWFIASRVRAEAYAEGRFQPSEQRKQQDVKSQSLVRKSIKPTLDEVKKDFESSKPTLGELLPELEALKRQFEAE